MDFGSRTRKTSKKSNDVLDDLLGDLLSEDSPTKKKSGPSTLTRQRSGSGKSGKSGAKDENFYQSLAAMADSDAASDISEADVDKVAHSIGGLDDMDADLFGDSLHKKNSTGRSGGKPTTPRRNTPKSKGSKSPTRVQSPTRSDTPTSPPGSARGSLKRKPVKPPSPSSTSTNLQASSPPQAQPEHKPGTAPGKMTDLSSASESLIPGVRPAQRPETAPKVTKKYDFGDFDPDDPLAGVLSDDDVDEISESDRPRSATKKPGTTATQSRSQEDSIRAGDRSSPQDSPRKERLDSPRKRNLFDRPPTRSGSNAGEGTNIPEANAATEGDPGAGKPGAGKASPGIFSDSDGEMLDGLGLDEDSAPAKNNVPTQKAKSVDSEDSRPARSALDSLLGKGTSASAAQLLERKDKKPFVLDSKYSGSAAGSGDAKDEEEDFQFGSYQPSAASGSRPNSRRSVRFQDDDDIFGLESRPSPRAKSPSAKTKAPADMEWLQLAAKSTDSATPATAPASTTPTAASTAAAGSGTPTSVTAGKPPAPTSAHKAPESPRKAPGGPVSNTAPSPRAWLGLEESESDDEFFKPKKSPARSAALPQSPALSTSASPRVLPKKPSKKDVSPKVSPAVSLKQDDDEEDDWLARAKSRRQQMLLKEQEAGKEEEGSSRSARGGGEEQGGGMEEQSSMKVDLSSLIVDSPKFDGSARHDELFATPQATPQSRSTGGPSWESPRSALSMTVNGGQLQGGLTPTTPHLQSQDPRLKFSASTFGQDQPDGEALLSNQSREPQTPLWQQQQQQQQQLQQQLLQQQQQQLQQQFQQQQQQQQLQFSQIQDQKKSELLQQQQQLQQKLQEIQTQYQSVARAQPPAPSTMIPSYSQISATVELPESLPEAHAKIRTLEVERSYSSSLLESTKRRYEEEMLAVETSYRNRLDIIEDSNRKREARLREENEQLMQQHLSRLRQLEQEKGELNTANYRRLEEAERDKAQELEKLKEHHRNALAVLKRDHEEALERLASAKNQEILKVASANDTSKSLTAVVEQIQSNARDLGELHMKVEGWTRQGLDEREISLRSKDEQLRMLQERLKRQEEDNERERKRLEELIARMETQLREQTRTMEEERWKLKQDQSRAEAQQRALEEERRLWLEQQARERITMERSRENYLEEQRGSMAQLSEERRLLTEERTKFQVEQKTAREKMQQDTIKRSQAEADYEVLTRSIAEEKTHRAARVQELEREEERIAAERSKLEREKSKLEQDQDKLASQARQIREQSEQIDRVTEAARRSQQDGEQAMEEAMQYNSQIERREADIQKQLSALKVMEDHISQEKLRMAKEKKEVENLKHASLCTNCRAPLQGGNLPPPPRQNGYYTPQYMSTAGQPPPQMVNFSSSAHQLGANPLDHIAFSIANDRAVRMLKIQAIKDKEFLEEESIYLESLRHSPYHSTASKT